MCENLNNPAVTETKPEKKKIVFSAIQPTGVFTLGNYMGAIKNWIPM